MAEINTTPSADSGVNITALTHPPVHQHGAFDDLEGSLNFLRLGIDALKGFGEMMQTNNGGGQMQASIWSAQAVFEFFGKAMEEPAREAFNAMETLQRYAKDKGQP